MGHGFESFSFEHFFTLFFFGIVTFVVIRKGQVAMEPERTDLVLMISGLTFSTLIIEAILKFFNGTYDILVDLPFYLCDIVILILPFVLLYHNRKWIGILYFWALAGAMQALITPDIGEGFPSFEFFRYFIAHAGIILAMLYTIIVRRIRIGWPDFINAVIYAQVYLVVIHLINTFLGSNYGYTMQKPPGASVLDLMGPWPWYIFWGEFLMIGLYLLLIVPFLFRKVADDVDEPIEEGGV